MNRTALILVVTLLAACGAGSAEQSVVRFEVTPGTPLGVVARELESRDVIWSAAWFKIYARLTGRQRAIQQGLYDLPLHSSSRLILNQLTSGVVVTNTFVVPEGLRISEIAELAPSIGISNDDFLAAARDSGLIASLDIEAPTLEGYLYPSTYQVTTTASALDLVEQMAREFRRRWRPEWTERASELGLNTHEVITLASIIEGEVMYGPDRPYVSSVYHNRMNRGMRLQADPTVIFALGTRRRLFERDYGYRSPYNTYLIDGLPPGPIGQPSTASIEAALYPAESDFLFLVADTTGRHIFSRTLREHNGYVRELRAIWARRRR